MNKQQISIMRKAIKETENVSRQKWSVDKDGNLHWEYLTSEFFSIKFEFDEGMNEYLIIVEYNSRITGVEKFVCVLVGSEFYHDCENIEEGIYTAVASTIKKANYLF